MSKILFVDDEITRNLSVLTTLFEKFLTPEELSAIEQLRRRERGKNIDALKNILSGNPVLEVEAAFPEAIKRIKKAGNGKDYDAIIIDRNLSTGQGMYELSEVAELMPGYDENALERYQGKEGDFLLLMLHLQGVKCSEKVYFYSAYRADEIASALYLGHMLGFNSFSEHNFVDKNDESISKFKKDVIDNLQRATIVSRYRGAFSGLCKVGLAGEKDHLIDLLLDHVNTGIEARLLLERLFEALPFTPHPFMNPVESDAKLADQIKALRCEGANQTVPQFVAKHAKSIQIICNAYGAHTSDPEGFPQPTPYTWGAVKYQLLEIFFWLNTVL